jgi:hypothetical protein
MDYYLLFTTVCTFLLFMWVGKRIVYPLTCACGFRSVFISRFKRHLLQGHKWIDHQ